jgi:Protein of unknown function (DUF2867)
MSNEPRTHLRLPARGRLGAADAGRPGRLPPVGAAVCLGRPVAKLLPRRPHSLRDPVEARGAARLGRPGRRPRLQGAHAPRPAAGGPARDPGPDFDALPFTSLYLLGDEWAAEIANRTMHGVMHIGLVPDGTGGYRAQMAVLVKPNGLFGSAYMAAIRPFRHLIVYPAMLREGSGNGGRALASRRRRTPTSCSDRRRHRP